MGQLLLCGFNPHDLPPMRLSCAPTQDGKDTSPFECMNQKETSLGPRSPLPLTPVTSVIEMHDQFYCPYL